MVSQKKKLKASSFLLFFALIFLASMSFISAFNDDTIMSCGGDNDMEVFCSYGSDQNQFVGGDQKPPNIELIQYDDGETDTDGKLNFKYRPSDINGIRSCSIFLEGTKFQTDNSVKSGNISNFKINNPPNKKSIDWYIKCDDRLLNTGVSETRKLTLEKDVGGGNLAGGTYNKTLLCNTTYSFALNDSINPQEAKVQYNNRSDPLFRISSNPLVKDHISEWQPMCSNRIGRTLKPKFVCGEIYDTYVENNLNPTDEEKEETRKEINEELEFSKFLNKKYFQNYKELCVIPGYSEELPKEEEKAIPIWLWVLLAIFILFLWTLIQKRKVIVYFFKNLPKDKKIKTQTEAENHFKTLEALSLNRQAGKLK